jgi:hypothetical protein
MSRIIPFIHNYCDRWCERCYFTGSCAVFERNKEARDEEKKNSNAAYTEKLTRNLTDALDLLKKNAKKHGIDLDKITQAESESIQSQMVNTRRLIWEEELIRLSREYARLATNLIENEGLWKNKADEILCQHELGAVPIQELEDQLHLIKECKEVISWYALFIEIKFSRAFSGRFEFDDNDDVQSDSNGSAKIAMLAVNRSKEAWTHLFELIPDEDNILPILSLLQRINKLAAEKFPRALQFVRPGFDEVGVY